MLFSAVLASLGALLGFAAWRLALAFPFQNAFLVGIDAQQPAEIDLWISILLTTVIGMAVGVAIERFGARQAWPGVALTLLALAVVSVLVSWRFAIDIIFISLLIAAVAAGCIVQFVRLWRRERWFTDQLIESAGKSGSAKAPDSCSRVASGLKLLETVMSPRETVVFRMNADGHLVSLARSRSGINSGNLDAPDANRNSKWRAAVSLSEKAIAENNIVTEQVDRGHHSLALPLRHEGRSVGAMFIRLDSEFDEDDRALLSAVSAQMARNLQREEAVSRARSKSLLALFSTREADKKFESLFVLKGFLSEQQFGVNALSYISEGLAIAYLDGTLAYTNTNLLHFCDLTEEQVRKLDLLSLLERFKTDVFDEPSIAVRRVFQTGEPYERELFFPERAATYGLRISLVRDNQNEGTGQPLCIAIHLTDVTRIKEHEKLKSDMISLMSHELRTPITSINGFAELLAAESDLPETAREFVGIIANESQRLSRMINTFLAVSQLERKDKQEVVKIPLRLDEVAREIVMSLQPVARKRRIRLVDQPAQRLPPVAADKSLISQAVKNLVDNAIKYSPERTTITVSTVLEAEEIRVSVEDRGFGIPAEARDRVWEKFYRVVREGQDKDEESTGLGLSFVREVVEQHGGRVNLETEEGRGSCFSFTLPRL